MRKDKIEIFKLRKTGKSFNEIRELFCVPKSTLSDWFKNQMWSHEIALNLAKKAEKNAVIRLQDLNNIRGGHLERLYKQAEDEAGEEFEKLKYHPLFLAGMMIFWGEGNKMAKSRCCIANSDPRMIRIFFDFLKKLCRIDSSKIKAWILLYPELKEDECKKFWIERTALNKDNFTKSIVIEGKHKTRKLMYGVCSI